MSAKALHIPLACRESRFWFALLAGGVHTLLRMEIHYGGVTKLLSLYFLITAVVVSNEFPDGLKTEVIW
jgi:hypothetical protein